MLIVYTVAIFLSAALLFLVEPMVGKMVLPVLGGAPAVWNTCMVFFQVLLLAGYVYAHLLTRYARGVLQVAIHGAVVLAALATLPIGLPRWIGVPTSEFPVPWLLGVLGAMAAGPFVVLSATGPLLQRWFAATDHARARDPYFLYAASNAGSLLALVAYPLAVEPLLSLGRQSAAWAVGYGLFTALILACAALRMRRGKDRRAGVEDGPAHEGQGVVEPASPDPNEARGVTWRARAWWVVLACAPSSLTLGVTTYLSSDLAPVPLLWVVPLSIYLATMMVAFGRFGPAATRAATVLLAPTVAGLTALTLLGPDRLARTNLAAHLVVLAVAGLACHGRLAERRPGTARLTEYFLLISVGGALGGVFNGIVAPLVFDRVLEYPAAIVVSCIAALAASSGAPAGRIGAWVRAVPGWAVVFVLGGVLLMLGAAATLFGGQDRPPVWRTLVIPAAVTLAMVALSWGDRDERAAWRRWALAVLAPGAVVALYLLANVVAIMLELGGRRLGMAAVYGGTGVACLMLARWPVRFGAAVGAMLLMTQYTEEPGAVTVLTERSFFGVHRVRLTDGGSAVELLHGTTHHGLQARGEGRELMPVSYYHPTGPIGEVLTRLNALGRVSDAAVVGLGTGALAMYARPGQAFTFYEIDPMVVRLAWDGRYFTYLKNCPGLVECRTGDGRLVLSRSQSMYDVIVLDAFNSDSIPVHLMTVEAMSMYAQHLRDRGVLAVHTSNRHLRLAGVVMGNARRLGFASRRKLDWPTEQEVHEYKAPSEWVVVAQSENDLTFLNGLEGWERPDQVETWSALRVWTDDYSNIVGVFATF